MALGLANPRHLPKSGGLRAVRESDSAVRGRTFQNPSITGYFPSLGKRLVLPETVREMPVIYVMICRKPSEDAVLHGSPKRHTAAMK